ncbi:MAG: MFS transporter [Bdellovibrionota bacterium]
MPADFKRLMAARFFFSFAVQMQVIVLGWRMYELTHDPLHLGLIGLVEAIPALSLALFAGYIVDHSNPLRIYRKVVLVSFTSGMLMLFSQMKSFDLSISLQVTLLFTSSFLTGLARSFSQPAMYSMVPKLIPKNLIPKSSAYMSGAMQVSRISGPALGGILYGFIGVSGTASIVCFLLLTTLTITMMIKLSHVKKERDKTRSVKEELLMGARFVFRHPILFPALTLDMVSVLFGGVTALLPIFAAEILMTGPKGLGILRAAPAVGAALMSFILIKWEIKKKAGPWLFTGVAGFGISILVFALSRDFTLSLFALAFSGAFDSISMLVRTAAVQLSSPENMRGRISAVNSIFIGSSNELGEFESGLAAKLLGAAPASVLGGVVCLCTVGVVALLSPTLRRLNLEDLENS